MKTFFNFKYTASVLILKIFRANQIRFEQISNGGKTGKIHVIFNQPLRLQPEKNPLYICTTYIYIGLVCSEFVP
jgi:hypothetical protein